MEKTLIQLPLFQEDSLANPSVKLEKEKEQMTTDTSGMKLLELLPSANRNGSLEKMLTALLTSPMVQSCGGYKKIWKKRVSKSNVLLFQLQASVLGIKEKESGLLPTPNTMDHINRKGMRPSRAATNRKSGYLSEMIKMYPTPTQYQANTLPQTTHKMDQKNFQKKMSNLASRVRYQTMYPTPNAWDSARGPVSEKYIKNNPTTQITLVTKVAQIERKKLKHKTGGRLNPNFVEFLMGYPLNYTKIESIESKPSETQSCPKSPNLSQNQY